MMNDDFPQILAEAFAAARKAGKHDWRRMTVAVLKNRILQMTDRRFDEATYGASNFTELLARYPNLVSLDKSTRPPTAEWRPKEDEGQPQGNLRTRVRADLWRAVLDYSSGREYKWDEASGQALPVDAAPADKKIPTISREILANWRREFATSCQHMLDDPGREKLNMWAGQELGVQFLPKTLQAPWYEYLKDRVAAHVQEWFVGKGLEPPNVIVQRESTPPAIPAVTNDLRSFLHRCVDAMAEEELREIRLPAGVLFRLGGRG